ncbi:kinesin-like protein KIN-4B [Manduca sexta]|uniref:kinesin-like protein KIN-4B n=1 Tax=Manduca sexta TaxID=7130 RepID=UPI00188F5728|nr:kinesin-like protein KIN-4B [Manduca sexta]
MSSIARGCSACVLAYGQSATGKTFTMFGSEVQPGLVPRLCRAFDDQQPLIVTVSFLEIYNERVHDLLVGEAVSSNCHSLPRNRGNVRKDLRVREHPTKGPYVQNLRRVTVHNVESLVSLVNEGVRRRRTAPTRRNPHSSRSHALLEIVTPHATLHLADLAGSEKAGFEGPGSGRQKEGANINKSLVALSNVISALVTSGRGRAKFIPYRDSALTWLLKDCFTGNSSTFIIATVSPSVACYGESASTLRWAERASQLPTKKVANCEVVVTTKSDLQQQFNKLLAELARNHINYAPETGTIHHDTKYWAYKEKTIQSEGVNSTTNIGNILNIMHPRVEANNVESANVPVASGSSDVSNILDSGKISNAVSKEVEKIFGSTLERTSSGSDLKVIPPLRHKRREYRSQEVLPVDETIAAGQSSTGLSILPSQSEVQINNIQNADKIKIPHVSILHENQRAEIVAAVTDRLYTKLKKKEEAAVSRMESIVDKKIVEPLSELKICTNARQRLIELSQRALRNKRRIGIPAFTQTKISVIRVKDQGTDVQTDLDSYIVNNNHTIMTAYRDVSTETVPMTPRCKEIAVGPKFGSMDLSNKSTGTEKSEVIHKNSYTMTDEMVKHDNLTQTAIVPPPRRRRKAIKSTKYRGSDNKNKHLEGYVNAMGPVISINISQTYSNDSETQSSDDNSINATNKNIPKNAVATPDLLTNHTGDTSDNNLLDNACNVKGEDTLDTKRVTTLKDNVSNVSLSIKSSEDFSDDEDYSLPRVTVTSTAKPKSLDMKNIILGRNENMYPYNIVLSPTREIDHSKRTVTFKDIDIAKAINVASHDCHDVDNDSKCNQEKNQYFSSDDIIFGKKSDHDNSYSDCTVSTRDEVNSLIWKNNIGRSRTVNYCKRNYVPIYKSNSRYNTEKTRYYQDFLHSDKRGFNDIDGINCHTGNSFDEKKFRSSSKFYRSNDVDTDFKQGNPCSKVSFRNKDKYKSEEFGNIEKKILDACTDLEKSVKTYDDYIINFKNNAERDEEPISQRTPTEYLQHLIKLRREMIKTLETTPDIALNGSKT